MSARLRTVLSAGLAVAFACTSASRGSAQESAAVSRTDVLWIAVDDLNDWIGCLGGHPQAKTPNLDRLAARGVLFRNAHCQSPVCNPSRASMLTGLYPETTGIYFLNPDLRQSEVARAAELLPRRFEREGYAVAGAGKIFHANQNARYFPNHAGNMGGFGPLPDAKLTAFPGVRLWDWGAYPATDEEMPDHRIAAWAVARLAAPRDAAAAPAFLGVGFFRPHVPQYAPARWFEPFPLDSVQLPAVIAGDLADVPPYGVNLTRLKHIAPTQDWVVEHGEWPALVQSYLACVHFVDAQVGKVLDALDASPRAANTVVVLHSDHGFHLGEKERWAKRSLWEDSTRVPMIVAGPGIARGAVCDAPVELIDLYPTLLELTGLDPDPALEGQSLVPLLRDPEAAWPHMARTSFGPGNVAIRSERYRYIRYADGTEELYDHADDPHEWRNRIGDEALAEVVARLRAHLPRTFHEVLGQGSTGHKAFAATEAARPGSGRR